MQNAHQCATRTTPVETFGAKLKPYLRKNRPFARLENTHWPLTGSKAALAASIGSSEFTTSLTGVTLTVVSPMFTVPGRKRLAGMLADDALMKGRHDHDLE